MNSGPENKRNVSATAREGCPQSRPMYPAPECLLNTHKGNQRILSVRSIFMFSLFENLTNQEGKDDRLILQLAAMRRDKYSQSSVY